MKSTALKRLAQIITNYGEPYTDENTLYLCVPDACGDLHLFLNNEGKITCETPISDPTELDEQDAAHLLTWIHSQPELLV
jgi:hypothetical protein